MTLIPNPQTTTTRSAQRSTYRAFGLTIESDIPLPELTAIEPSASPDIQIVYGRDMALPTREQGVVAQFRRDGTHFLAWPDVAAFQFRSPALIEVQPYPDTPVTYLPFPLLGPIMALALHMRKLVTLHASAIDINGHGVIFVGDKLAGKSTTAAAFLRAGHRLLTDDLLAIQSDPAGALHILPAYGQLKLAEDAADAVKLSSATPLPLVYPTFEKRQHRLTADFQHDWVTPKCLYILDRVGERPGLSPLTGTQALTSILRYSYISRFGKAALSPADEARHMQKCAELARQVRVATLHVPHALNRLEETVELVRADCEEQA
ncbi:hypothetical protein [Sphingobium yanoikuyae]|uniref:hypothetical protein n=1 Tax=Sphingobium yanoikuyae TaxID=13690 RepID=UPI00242A8800|nr:hypothetical protein [Sphingobium yanoikuyae]